MAPKFRHMVELDEFEFRGFVSYPKRPGVLRRLRIHYNEYFRIFKCGIHGSGSCRPSRCSTIDIFGRRLHYCYDIRRKYDFVKFLVDEFYKENPLADTNMRSQFTRLLHSHGLCWRGCWHLSKEKIMEEDKHGK